jgi:microcystin-dependent protein
MDPIIGQIIFWPLPWIPRGWALCDGSELQIQQYQALFSLIGVAYGGDGARTFKLPDLRRSAPIS